MARVQLRDVTARYELLSVRDYNLKRRVVDLVQKRHEPPKSIHALRAVSLDLQRGSRLGLVGANGAGKSTLLSIMAGLLPPTSGSVKVEGRVLALLGGASAGLDQEATGRDNVVSMGVQLGETPDAMRARADEVLDFSGLGPRAEDPVFSYSTGMQARLRFSILTSLRPDVLLVDEGIGAADAAFAAKANARLHEFMSGAGIFVLASHGDDLLRQQCDQAIWIDRGVVRSQGPLESVLRQYHQSYEQEAERAAEQAAEQAAAQAAEQEAEEAAAQAAEQAHDSAPEEPIEQPSLPSSEPAWEQAGEPRTEQPGQEPSVPSAEQQSPDRPQDEQA